MKKKIISLIFLISVFCFLIFNFYAKVDSPTKPQPGSAELASKSSSASAKVKNPQVNSAPIKNISNGSKFSAAENSALIDMTQTLFQYTQKNAKLSDLFEFLERSGQKPVVVNNSNADTGEMAIVRTKAPPTGTRYFHAQFFSDEIQKGFVQHMSFEVKAGPESMNAAVSAVKNNFPHLASPKRSTADFIQWDLPDGQILWIKKLAANDLKDHPFNAYTPEDVGTILVAVELEIHDGQESHQR